jgi:hypothetical protein
MCCPKCKGDTHLQVEMTCWAKLTEDGTDASGGDHEWTDASDCRCTAENCGWYGDVYDARAAADAIRAEQEAQDETA